MTEKACSECSRPFEAKTNGVACSAACKRLREKRKQAAWKLANVSRVSEVGAARYMREREHIIAYVSEWRAKNPAVVTVSKRHARALRTQREAVGRARVSSRDLRRCLARVGNSCSYCAAPLAAVHWDHIVPLAKGGATTIGNLAPSCPSCNLSKGSKFLMEWRVWMRRHASL